MMKVPYIDFTREYRHRKEDIDRAIQGCLEKGNLIMRDEMVRFERDFADYVGAKDCIGTGSCTNAMFIALKALGIGPGDEVITVAHTYVATVDVIVACGATPVLVDVDWDMMVIDNEELNEVIGEKTKAIMPVNLNGIFCTIETAAAIPLIYDSAQAIKANMDTKDFACFSFFPAKILGGIGEGGAIVTDSDDMADKLYRLRDHGILPPYLDPSPNSYKPMFTWGYNTILDNTDAAVLSVKLAHLDESINARAKVAQRYQGMLMDVEALTLPNPPKGSVWQNYVIRTEYRDQLKSHLADKGIETLIHWPIPLHKQPVWQNSQEPVDLPVTERISRTCLSLPCYAYLTYEEQVYICNAIRSYFSMTTYPMPKRSKTGLKIEEMMGENPCLG